MNATFVQTARSNGAEMLQGSVRVQDWTFSSKDCAANHKPESYLIPA